MDTFSPIRKIRCFIPPSESPLLTTYSRSLLPKLTPLKKKFHILNKSREKPGKEMNPQTVVLCTPEVDIVNSLYRKIKRSRGESVHLRETSYVKDPLYKSIYNLKRESAMISREGAVRRNQSFQ